MGVVGTCEGKRMRTQPLEPRVVSKVYRNGCGGRMRTPAFWHSVEFRMVPPNVKGMCQNGR
eukprot:1143808-Pyramimonas_sp.AAC.1